MIVPVIGIAVIIRAMGVSVVGVMVADALDSGTLDGCISRVLIPVPVVALHVVVVPVIAHAGFRALAADRPDEVSSWSARPCTT